MIMRKISYIATHHFGGTKYSPFDSSVHTTLEQINNAHKSRWPDFPSTLKMPDGSLCYIGYNFVLLRNKRWFQARPIGAETAAQRGFNFNTVSFAFSGNFIKRNGIPVNTPDLTNITDYRTLAIALLDNNRVMLDRLGVVVAPNTEIKITPTNIHKHSYYQQGTECNALPDSWGRDLLADHIRGYGNLQIIYASILELATRITRFRKIGATTYDCGAARN